MVGSSARSSGGRQASAAAIMARCRMPPLSWCGYSDARRLGSAMPTSRSASTVRSQAARRPSPSCRRSPSATCSPTGHTGFEGGQRVLKDDADLLAADRRASRARRRRSARGRAGGCSSARTAAADGSRRRTERAVSVLPQPLSPTRASVSPSATANETPSTAGTAAETDGQVVNVEEGHRSLWFAASAASGRPGARGSQMRFDPRINQSIHEIDHQVRAPPPAGPRTAPCP